MLADIEDVTKFLDEGVNPIRKRAGKFTMMITLLTTKLTVVEHIKHF